MVVTIAVAGGVGSGMVAFTENLSGRLRRRAIMDADVRIIVGTDVLATDPGADLRISIDCPTDARLANLHGSRLCRSFSRFTHGKNTGSVG